MTKLEFQVAISRANIEVVGLPTTVREVLVKSAIERLKVDDTIIPSMEEQSRLLSDLLSGVPLRSFYLKEDLQGVWHSTKGDRRLATLLTLTAQRGEPTPFCSTHRLKALGDYTWGTLPRPLIRKALNRVLDIRILLPTTWVEGEKQPSNVSHDYEDHYWPNQ